MKAIFWVSEVDESTARESHKLSFRHVPSIRFATTVTYNLLYSIKKKQYEKDNALYCVPLAKRLIRTRHMGNE